MLIWKALILCWSLLVYVGLKVASKIVKKIESKIFLVYMSAPISIKGLFNLWWDSYDKQRLCEWDIICCCIVSSWDDLSYEMNIVVQGKKTREKWMRHELICICCLKLESLHMKLNGEFILIKKISYMTQINVKFKVDG